MLGEVRHRDRGAELGAGADDEADLRFEVQPLGRAEDRGGIGRRLPLAMRADDRGAGRHDGAGTAVVTDRQVLPVRGQRDGSVGAEDLPRVSGVLLARVKVDIIPYGERQVHADRVQRGQRRLAAGEQAGYLRPDPRPAGPALRHEGVQRRLGEHRVAEGGREVQHLVAKPDPAPRGAAGRGEHAVGQVGQAEAFVCLHGDQR